MQVAEGKQPFCDWDGLRTLRFSAFRCLVFSPLYVGWITLLERITLPRHSAVMAKTLLDSLVWTPTFHSIFYTWMAVTEGMSLREACARTWRMLPTTVPASWVFWMPVQAVNFWFVPVHLRVTLVNVISAGWSAVMSGFNEYARCGAGSPPLALPECEQVCRR